jgi:hypothetical protein
MIFLMCWVFMTIRVRAEQQMKMQGEDARRYVLYTYGYSIYFYLEREVFVENEAQTCRSHLGDLGQKAITAGELFAPITLSKRN